MSCIEWYVAEAEREGLTLLYTLRRAARSLISHLLAPDPTQRATARQALESEWIVSSQAKLEGLYKKIVPA